MDIHPIDLYSKNSSLPPIKHSKNNQWKGSEGLSNKLQLYIKFRTATQITINSPIETLLPSSISRRSNSIPIPTQADVVMSKMPPILSPKYREAFKYSRLFEIKHRKDNSFLEKSYKAQEQPMVKTKNLKHILQCKNNKNMKKMKRENLSKKSIPFLSDIMNKVCKQGSKVLFSPHGPLESNDVLIDISTSRHFKDFEVIDAEASKTIDACLQTEEEEKMEIKKRRVIFNRNSSFRKRHSDDFEEGSNESTNN